MIESYRFGHITVNGVEYTEDLIIFPDHVQDGWWRDEGHRLNPQDLEAVLEYNPKVLVVGKGAYGRMKVTDETSRILEDEGINLIAERTGKAKDVYNELLEEGRRAVAALHLTC
ncbi:MAG: Mth938-like domain-containing protein [Candidatus Bathyarchaeia archaeon]